MLANIAMVDTFMSIFEYKRVDKGEYMESEKECVAEKVEQCKNCDQKYTCKDAKFDSEKKLKHCMEDELAGACLDCDMECRECDRRDTCESSEWHDNEHSFVEKMSKSDVIDLLKERDDLAADYEILSADFDEIVSNYEDDCDAFSDQLDEAIEIIEKQYNVDETVCGWALEKGHDWPSWILEVANNAQVAGRFLDQFKENGGVIVDEYFDEGFDID